MDDDHLVPWDTRFPKLVSCTCRESAKYDQLVVGSVADARLQLFRGAAIGNRRLLARDSEFVSANNVDFLLTNGTGAALSRSSLQGYVVLANLSLWGCRGWEGRGSHDPTGALQVQVRRCPPILVRYTPFPQGGVCERLGICSESSSCRYLLHMAGGAWSARLKYLLLCGSLVLWPDDGWQDFWSHLLQVPLQGARM